MVSYATVSGHGVLKRYGIVATKIMCLSLLFCVSLLAVSANAVPYTIDAPAAPQPWERTAVQELREYLGRLATESDVKIGRAAAKFHVGGTDFARSAGLAPESLKEEEWIARCLPGGDVVLVGGGTRGTLYAVYHFLEDVCGVRWWSDDDEDVPSAASLDLTPFDLHGRPFFRRRQIYRGGVPSPRTAARCRINDNGDQDIPLELGAGCEYGLPYHSHVWDRYFPFEKYGKTHPEWYSLRDGKRIGGQEVAQMCLTCPGLVDEFAKAVESSIAKDAENCAKRGGYPLPKVYSLAMNDNWNYCQCTNCMEEIDKLGCSGQLIRFANEVAGKVGARHPNVYLSVSAYNYTIDPPKQSITPASNVIIGVANTTQNMGQPITHPSNRHMHDLILEWRKVAHTLFFWDYTVTYIKPTMGFPFPGEYAIPGNLRFYADNGGVGITIEHENPERSDMYELKFWLDRKLLEDPYLDGEALRSEFYARYYGPAAAKVREVREFLRRIYEERDVFLSWFPPTGEFNWMTDADIANARGIFDEAEAVAKGNAKLERRVKRARMGFDLIAEYRSHCGTLMPPEPGVAEGEYIDFRTDKRLWSLYRLSELKFVDDPSAANGLSVRFPANTEKGFTFPIQIGLASNADKSYGRHTYIKEPSGPGWNWYVLPKVKFPPTVAYVYFTWNLQLPATSPDIAGGTFNVKFHARFEQDACYVDRIIFEKVGEDKLDGAKEEKR